MFNNCATLPLPVIISGVDSRDSRKYDLRRVEYESSRSVYEVLRPRQEVSGCARCEAVVSKMSETASRDSMNVTQCVAGVRWCQVVSGAYPIPNTGIQSTS